eukprot:1831508-Pyramimonas_sp.AAC.1
MLLGATRFICVQLEPPGFTMSHAEGIVAGSSAQVVQIIRMGLIVGLQGLGGHEELAGGLCWGSGALY